MKQTPISSILLALAAALLLTACNGLPVVDAPPQTSGRFERAIESRENLWAALQQDKNRFTTAEWQQAQALHDRAVTLSADLTVGLSLGGMPPVADVEEWMLVGKLLHDEAAALLVPRFAELSQPSRAAWALEQARLRALQQTGQHYLDNPDAQTYRQLLRVGLSLGRIILGGVL